MRVNDRRCDLLDLTRERRGPDERESIHRGGDVQLSESLETSGEASEVLQTQDMRLKPVLIQMSDKIEEDALHPTVVQILDHVQDANGGSSHCRRIQSSDSRTNGPRSSQRRTSNLSERCQVKKS